MASTIREDLFYGTVYGLGLSVALWTLTLFPPTDPGCVLLVALSAAAGTVRLSTRAFGRLHPVYPAVLAGALVYGAGAALLAGLACCASAALTRPRAARRGSLRHGAFVMGCVTLAATIAATVYHATGGTLLTPDRALPAALPLVVHAAAFATVRRVLASLALRIVRRGRPRPPFGRRTWMLACAYCLGTLSALGFAWLYVRPQIQPWLAVAGLLLLVDVARRAARGAERLRQRHQARFEAWHAAVVRALTRTIEATENATPGRARRIQRLCIAVGRRLDLSELEMDALTSGALLHDLGKVAVPAGILSKPGRLTPDERNSLKMHAEIGADILQGIPFPFPVAPTVRHHHERWDGQGYPAGLRGEAIPLTARVLAVVECYDALTSDRPDRWALSPEEALEFLHRERGLSFDPCVVDALLEHLDGIESTHAPADRPTEAVERTGAEAVAESSCSGGLPLAQRELETLYDISRAMDHSLNLDEFLTLAACKLAPLVPYQSFVVYFIDPENDILRAGFTLGKAADKLRLTTIPMGERVSGWAASRRRTVDGHDYRMPIDRKGPEADLEDWGNDIEMSRLASTLAAPLTARDRTLGVLTLYDHADRRYSADDKRILARVAGYVARTVQQQDQRSSPAGTSLTDPLTGVPNARFLWLESAQRISRPETAEFGLLAFRVVGVEEIVEREGNEGADRLLCEIARRFAVCSFDDETLVRFGQDLFIVLTSEHEQGDLSERWHRLATEIEVMPWRAGDGSEHKIRLAASHACCPSDGSALDALLDTLDVRLGDVSDGKRTVVPFRLP